MTAFTDIPDRLLGPLEKKGEDVWYAAPPSAWSPGEIVAHIATALTSSAGTFASRRDKPPMHRRLPLPIQFVARAIVLGTGWFPVRRQAPAMALPPTRPDRAATEAQLRDGVARFGRLAAELLPARRGDLFVKHPAFGDLTIEEWMRFHVVHTEHHRKQLIRRISLSPVA